MTTKPFGHEMHPGPAGPFDDIAIQYPSSDGNPVTETVAALRTRFIDRTGVYLAGDMLAYYRMNDNTVSVAPDLFAVFGAAGNRPRGVLDRLA